MALKASVFTPVVAKPTGETEDGKTPSIMCEMTETEDAYLLHVPKRIATALMDECKPNTKGKITQAYAKLQFPGFTVRGYGTDDKGREMECDFPTADRLNFNLFVKL